MIGIGWATLYNTMIENYEKKSKFETYSQQVIKISNSQ
jgi:hypothetical protein